MTFSELEAFQQLKIRLQNLVKLTWISAIHVGYFLVHGRKHLLLKPFLGLEVFLLVSVVVTLLLDDVAIHVDMEDHVLNVVVGFVNPVLE